MHWGKRQLPRILIVVRDGELTLLDELRDERLYDVDRPAEARPIPS